MQSSLSTQELHEAVAYAPTKCLEEIADLCLEGAQVEVLQRPEPSLVMLRVGETVDREVFNLGEVLVTSCEVDLAGELGWGIAVGDDPVRALCAAILDAASRLGFTDGAEEALRLHLASARDTRRERWAGVQATRVKFEETSL